MRAARTDVTIVSGLPRSGTSMMMAMLEAGGLPLLADDHRLADESNPNGYYEYEPVLNSKESLGWIQEARGKAVKAIYLHLQQLLPDFRYRIIFMNRNMGAVIRSQEKMLRSLGQEGANLSSARLEELFLAQITELKRLLATQKNVSLLDVFYESVLESPCEEAHRIASFLDTSLNVELMARVVAPDLNHAR